MIERHQLIQAFKAFNHYINQYDLTIPLIRLKVVHTYQVVLLMKDLCERLGYNEEDLHLAMLIGLLHDIGRFEQYRRYQTFEDYKSVDHALYSSELLFQQGLIRAFIQEDAYDVIIQQAIEQHNKFRIDPIADERVLRYVHLIRDADKLDNFRVKETESFETLFNLGQEALCLESLSDKIYDDYMKCQLIYGPDRKTHLDMWLSYIAFIFDLYYPISIEYIKEHNWVKRSFQKLTPIHAYTKKQYQDCYKITLEYVERKCHESY